ncbi:hypothetical protein [Deinococcus yavapaiensis]|uniref:Ig-like protein group 2 n=1 Tax=Deinococcus yavapaiensis KR-236 TaxID=694435 RepID=A0A318SI36_9DEIO|nr:hypothetical protein [Deinococcus yavapaiensis]PYE51042.1 hypothetical protein DES52_116109 [Deinococcus yavapaiensis KR-236]
MHWKLAPALFLVLGGLLAACNSNAVPPSVATVTVGGTTNLEVGKSANLTALLRDSAGNTLSGRTVTWTSSNPNLISVNSDGQITARHLSVSRAPATITATSEGKIATINVTTYGLDVIGGTFVDDTTPGRVLYAGRTRFQDPAGQGVPQDTDVTVQGPAEFNGGQPLTMRLFSSISAGNVLGGLSNTVVSGQYTATATIGGTVYTKTFTVDVTKTLSFITNPSLTLNGTSARLQGTADVRAKSVQGELYKVPTPFVSSTTAGINGGAFDVTVTFATLTSGTYKAGIYARDFVSNDDIFADQVAWSFTSTSDVTVP